MDWPCARNPAETPKAVDVYWARETMEPRRTEFECRRVSSSRETVIVYWPPIGRTISSRCSYVSSSQKAATASSELTISRPQRDHFDSMDDYSMVAQELSVLGEKMRDLDDRLAEVERVNARLEDAALTTARALAEISHHWDAVYEAMRRAETTETSPDSERDNDAARRRRM